MNKQEKQMKKQIEEMAHALCTWWNGKGCTFGMITNKARPCRFDCNAITDAERLYNAGYRKHSEGEWETKYKPTNPYFPFFYMTVKIGCSVCGYEPNEYTDEYKKYNYCPYCGARMKGATDEKAET